MEIVFNAAPMKTVALISLGTVLVISGCDNPKPGDAQTTASSAKPQASASAAPESVSAAASASAAPSAAPSASAAAGGAPSPAPSVDYKAVGLMTPESVVYDATDDDYLVSNINGTPFATDNNGFISQLAPDGKVKNLKFIEGGKNNAKLDAPKGMAIVGDVLYVADITTVRMFDRKTGAPKGEVKIPGSTFLNDVGAAPDGTVFVSDSGMKGGFEGTGTDAVWSIDKAGKATKVAASKDLNRPNGVLPTGDKTWVVSFGAAELYSLTPKGEKKDVTKLPKGSLDGLVAIPGAGGDVLVSSWESSSIFRGKPGGEFKEIITGVKSPADIGYDTKRGRVLVPIFQGDEVMAFDVK
jgi:hypothetical protein